MNVSDIPDLIIDDAGMARPAWATTNDLLKEYYDQEWGMPIRDEVGLFERLSLEGFQAGLSWEVVLRKREAFRSAFAGFDPDKVAAFDESDMQRLLNDATIIRNRLKIQAVITNARATIELRTKGGLAKLVWSFQPAETPTPVTVEDIPTMSPESTALAKALKQEGFTFVGPTTMYALMGAIGIIDVHLLGSHRRGSSGIWS